MGLLIHLAYAATQVILNLLVYTGSEFIHSTIYRSTLSLLLTHQPSSSCCLPFFLLPSRGRSAVVLLVTQTPLHLKLFLSNSCVAKDPNPLLFDANTTCTAAVVL